ncbi:MAG: alpha/beta hydrolase [Pseudomonadota bacterium]
MAWLDREGGQIYYEYHGRDLPAECLRVVLSHGFGMSCRVWDNTTAKLLDAGYAVVVYDQRGCGHSTKDFSDVGVDVQGDDLVALCAATGAAGLVLNGWSFGGAVVVDAAEKLGERLCGLVSTAGATPRYTQSDGFAHGGMAADVVATVDALRADRVNFLQALYFEGVFAQPVSAAVKQWCLDIALQASPAADAALGALAEVDQRAALADLTCPALFVVGTADGVVDPQIGRFAAAAAPHGQLAEMPECGHAPFLEAADAYHASLLKFLHGIQAGRNAGTA